MPPAARFDADPPPLGYASWREWEEDLPAALPGSPGWDRLQHGEDNLQPPQYRGLAVGGEVLISAAALLADPAALAPLPYLDLLGADGYFVKGWAGLLTAYPKAGKTELLVRVIRSWLDAGVRILWLTEEPRSVWAKRLYALGGDWPGLTFCFGLGYSREDLLAIATGHDADVVILDTLRNLLGFENENDNSEVVRVVVPWVAAMRKLGRTFIALHHQRKGGGAGGEGIAGASALFGVFDVSLEIARDPQAPNRRTVRTISRLLDPQEAVYERSSDGTFRLLGAPRELRAQELAARVTAALDGADWLKTGEIIALVGDPQPSAEAVRKVLLTLHKQGVVERDPPDGRQGKTAHWRLAHLPSTAEQQAPVDLNNLPSNGQPLVRCNLEVPTDGLGRVIRTDLERGAEAVATSPDLDLV